MSAGSNKGGLLSLKEYSDSKIDQLAVTTDLVKIKTNELVDKIAVDILHSIYKRPREVKVDGKLVLIPLTDEQEKFNARVEGVYKDWFNQDYPKFQPKVRATAAYGPPGHGKTSSVEAASKKVAEAMGMRYVSAEDLEYVDYNEIDINTFVMNSVETVGMTSAMEFFGMPATGTLMQKLAQNRVSLDASKDQIEKLELTDAEKEAYEGRPVKYLDRLFSLNFLKTMAAGGSTVVLDDFMNSNHIIQNVGLTLLDRRRFGALNLGGSYFATTGNLGGALDGTSAQAPTSALRTRVLSYLVHDTPFNFVMRQLNNKEYNDDLGDVFVSSFLTRYPEFFFGSNDSESNSSQFRSGFSCPRTLKNFSDIARECVHRHGGREHIGKASVELRELAQASLGSKAANAYEVYLSSIMTNADPMARKFILEGLSFKDGSPELEAFNKCYDASKGNSNDLGFSYMFADSIVDYTVAKVRSEGMMDEALKRFGLALSFLDQSAKSYAINEINFKLSAQVPKATFGIFKGDLNQSNVVSDNKTEHRNVEVELGTVTDKVTGETRLKPTVIRNIGHIMLSCGRLTDADVKLMSSGFSENDSNQMKVRAAPAVAKRARG